MSLPVCKNGGLCKESNPKHYKEFSHPPKCYITEHKCPDEGLISPHYMFFFHEHENRFSQEFDIDTKPSKGFCTIL